MCFSNCFFSSVECRRELHQSHLSCKIVDIIEVLLIDIKVQDKRDYLLFFVTIGFFAVVLVLVC